MYRLCFAMCPENLQKLYFYIGKINLRFKREELFAKEKIEYQVR